jgi:hypothetical protein
MFLVGMADFIAEADDMALKTSPQNEPDSIDCRPPRRKGRY